MVKPTLRNTISHAFAAGYLARKTLTHRLVRPGATGRRSIPIFNFHRVSEYRLDHHMTIAPGAFHQVLRELQRRYDIVTLAEVDRVLASGSNSDELLAITFDDSYGCNFEFAIPVLRELRIPATFFVATAFVDTDIPFPHDAARGFMDLPNFTTAQLRSMAQDRSFELGSHTVTHIDFSGQVSDAEIERELVESRQALEAISGLPVTRLAIPWGSLAHCSERVLAKARTLGYERVYSHFGGRNAVNEDGELGLVLHRICELGSANFVRAMIEGYRGRLSLISTQRVVRLGPLFHPCELSRSL